MKMRSAMLAVGLLACLAVPVAAGLWSNFPTQGVAAHCASTNQANTTVPTGSTNCTTTIPAGPTTKSGLETVPADTNAAGGAAPQTVNFGLASLNALPITVQAALTSSLNTISATALQGGIILTASGTISQVTLSMPPNPIDDQQFALSANQTITTLLVNAWTGDSIDTSPTVLTKSTTGAYGYRWVYDKTTTKWYRLQ